MHKVHQRQKQVGRRPVNQSASQGGGGRSEADGMAAAAAAGWCLVLAGGLRQEHAGL